MEIYRSDAQPPNPLVRPAVSQQRQEEQLAALLAKRRRDEAQEQRERLLDGCPDALTSFAAGAVALVYHPFHTVLTKLEGVGATRIAFFDAGGSQAVGFERDGLTWLVFRGSESSPETEMFLDWGHDVAFLPWGWPPQHLGFVVAWRRIRKPVLEWLGERPAGSTVVLSGHSLGGALATTAAFDLSASGKTAIEAVITFGSPRVGTWPWTWAYQRRKARPNGPGSVEATLRDVTWRVHNEGDVVTYVPAIVFAHCGRDVSSTRLQAGPPNPFALASAHPLGPADTGRAAVAYRAAKSAWPYSPLTLLVDLLWALAETAPQHFMRHYAPAFPERAFRELGAPAAVPSTGTVNAWLRVLKHVIVVGVLALVGWIGWKAFMLSPELSVGLIAFSLLYAVLGAPVAPAQPVTPSFLRRPDKSG